MVQLLNELLLAPVTREHAATVLVTVLEKCDCPSTYQYSTVQQKPAQALMCLQLFDQLHLDQLLRANLNSNLCPVGEGASSSVQLMRQLTLVRPVPLTFIPVFSTDFDPIMSFIIKYISK
jgi:hypothetical protein